MRKQDEQMPTADAGPVERVVGRPAPERDQDGPRGTYGCACVSDSARLCALLRYDRDIDSREQHDDEIGRAHV